MIRPGNVQGFRQQSGFTLLEVLVAMTLIGIGFSTAFVAISGSRRLSEKTLAHESARILARAKLDEVLHSKGNSLTDDGVVDHYAGQAFGFQIKVRPVEMPFPDGLNKNALPFVLEDVSIDVYWGPTDSQQSYRLSTMRLVPKSGSTVAQGRQALSSPGSRTP
jgi:prepilin-type N-terminal cleavage/methylation domain-containing protein